MEVLHQLEILELEKRHAGCLEKAKVQETQENEEFMLSTINQEKRFILKDRQAMHEFEECPFKTQSLSTKLTLIDYLYKNLKVSFIKVI